MTREEAIRIIKTMEINNRPVNNSVEACEEVANRFIALDMAIKALEQKPCDNAILRQAVHIELEKWITYGEYKYSNATKYLYDRIDRLPPVNPQEPLTEEDYIELHDRFGDYVVFVVKDMISGKDERWTQNNPQEPKYCDRNICVSNEYNGIGCDECEVMAESEGDE